MDGKFDSRHPLVGLVDELTRLTGRLKSTFAGARKTLGLGDSEMVVLNAVVEADRPPTVPQIGRSFGHPRQLVQRAAKALEEQGLIETLPNPDHKRAVLLSPTPAGVAAKREMDERAHEIAEGLSARLDLGAIRDGTIALRQIRKDLEMTLRGEA